ncbi:penicillin acylase family protein [Actinocorallia populi]|uniref:penicillin acylase family protein n=1 Tax=Actinocorallia populi TaxID=2079200 RepID=UPI001E5250CB|nr:penicillin acylase family protein [Actinocorallia populi]
MSIKIIELRGRSGRRAAAVATVLAAAVTAVVAGRMYAMPETRDERYSAQIRRTEYGVPHVTAKDHGGLGYGYGYAFAQDDLCVMASRVVTLRGERSEYFGSREVSDDPIEPLANPVSDVYYKGVRASGVLQRTLARAAPLGPAPELRRLVDGYAAGYNRYLRDTGVERLPDPACRGEEWVRPITALDVWSVILDANRVGTAGFREAVATAAPAGDTGRPRAAPATAVPEPGSNAWALGRKATRGGHGMLLADPHLPWHGGWRLYQVHLTIPGVLDVSGAGLYGTPVVQIGHTAGVAWTHTTSHARRHTLYRLTLAPGDPTGYLVDGKTEPMGRQEVEITLRDPVGGTVTTTRTLYTSRYGPVLAAGWTSGTAFALADANAANLRSANEWLAMGSAQNLAQLRAAQRTYQGIPTYYTLATDVSGTAYFADASVVPHVTDDLAERCAVAPEGGERRSEELILDGSTSACGWGEDPDAVEPGVFGPGRHPTLTRTDYVANSNDGPWLANPAAPLTGFPRAYGETRTELRLRARLGLDMISQRLNGTDGLGPPGFTLENLQAAATGKRNHSAELARPDLLAVCRAHPVMTATDGRRTDVRQACDTLSAWDGRARLDSRGALLWRELFTRLKRPGRAASPEGSPPAAPSGPAEPEKSPWRVPFDPADPLTTPRGLDREDPAVRRALADTVQRFQDNGVSLALTPGEVQRRASIPLPGCTDDEGCFDRVSAPGVLDSDSSEVSEGSSFMMAVELTPDGPRTRTVLTYSQSADPSSPHHADQTSLFSRGRWVTERFTEAEITAYPHLRTLTLHG